MSERPEPAARAPSLDDDEPPPSALGKTAVMPAEVQCPECSRSSPGLASACVHCGAILSHGAIVRARSGWGGAPPARPTSDRPPSRRALAADDDEEIPAMPLADPLIGVIVAERYRIVEGLGRGGMGIVYKVEHTRIGKLLAMKLLTGELSRNPDVVRRFKQEALTVSRLSSPNTVQVFDFGVSEGLTYLVMELVAGEDLGRALRAGGPMPFSRLGRIVIQVCSSLAEAHHNEIVHRDIKPENVMLLHGRGGADVAKVLDFGLAKLRDTTELNDVTSQGAIVGTPYFMSPEQVRGEPVDSRSDLYSLGALMYRALTGHYPFHGPTPMAVFTKHLTETPLSPRERAPELDIPEEASAIVVRALAKDPSKRFQRAEEMQAAVLEALRELGAVSADELLDSGAMRALQRSSKRPPTPALSSVEPAIATRNEVEAYERKLRRMRTTAVVSAIAVTLAVAGGVTKLTFLLPQAPFSGLETEPNNTAAEANAVPFGRGVNGLLGKRLDAGRSDRDFFAVDVPHPGPESASGEAIVRLKLTALPNMATCALLYRQGLATAVGQYCFGRPGRGLDIPALRLAPGKYLVGVLQDMDPYGAPAAPFVHENVSDSYTLLVEPADAATLAGREVEPNDQVASANFIAVGQTVTGTVGWVRDEDVFCAARDSVAARFRVADGVREAGVVLEVTPLRGTEEAPPVRVNTTGKTPSDADVPSPWTSPPLEDDGRPRCIRIRLASDPWSTEAASPSAPRGSAEAYTLHLEALER